jgi:hypothetical protein
MTILGRCHRFITWIGDGTGAPVSILHVHAGMAALLPARLIMGQSLATPISFAVMCVAEFANEILDRLNHASWHGADTSLDVANTLF